MLTSGLRLTARARRRRPLTLGVALSLGLHLLVPLLLLIGVAEPRPPSGGGGGPGSVEIVADVGPVTGEKPPTPAAAVPTEPLPPGPETPPAPDAPPPTPEAQAPPPPPPPPQADPPPPPPPDQTEVAAVEPPAPEPPPPTPQAEPPPPAEAQPPPASPQRAAARPTPRGASAPARTATTQAARGPSPGPANPAGAQPPEGPEPAVRVEGAELGPEWIKQLQAWWDRHAFFPGEAAVNNVSGTVKVHFVVRPDGEVTTIHVEGGSGSKLLDNAAYVAFRDAHLHPFPPGTPAPKADVYVTLHYVLTHGQVDAALAKRPFTVTEKPVPGAVVATMSQKTCTGVLVLDTSSGELDSWRGRRQWARATFYRAPDGKPRLKFSTNYVGSVDVAVSEHDGSAGWLGPQEKKGGTYVQLRFALWPAGPDHVGGSVMDVYSPANDGAIDLICEGGSP